MKTKFYSAIIIALLFASADLNAQTNTFPATGAAGIGTISPNASSLLEISSTAKGFLISRMTKAQRDAIITPATGLLIYQTNSTPGFYYYNGSIWSAVTARNFWSLNGNAGTNPATNFVGTTDAQPLVFRVNNVRAGFIDNSTYNTSLGYKAFISNTTGNFNTATGYASLSGNTTGTSNTTAGYYSLFSNTTGNLNTAYGTAALAGNTGGNENTALGAEALNVNNGNDNTATGAFSLAANTSGGANTANGSYALYLNTRGSSNTAIGYNSLYSDTSGNFNTAIGLNSSYFNISGNNNTSTGVSALYLNLFGNDNTAYGSNALFSNKATQNTAVGSHALYSNNSGRDNVAIGYNALYAAAGGGFQNVAVGDYALLNATGLYNINNVAIGYSSLFNNTQGYQNTAVGEGALSTNTAGTNNTALGIGADVSSANLSDATAIGSFAIVNASNKIRLGDVNVTVVESQVGSWTTSDGRFKNNIKENVKGLEFIKLLRPVTYNFDTRKFEEFLIQNYPDSIKKERLAAFDKNTTSKASSIIQSGFIAQEVADAVKKSGYNFNGVHAPENSSDNWSLSYEKLVVPLVKAVQELSAMNDAKEAKIDTLQNQLNELRTLVLSIQQQQQSCSPCSAAATNAGATQSYAVITDAASLQQNIPNPFTNNTTIGYSLPQKIKAAQIIITDKSGKTLKAVTISGSGKGSLNVDASTLASGAYQYSLMVDGRLIATKQMVLAK